MPTAQEGLWIADFLPDEAAEPIAALMEQGMAVMKKTLDNWEPREPRPYSRAGIVEEKRRWSTTDVPFIVRDGQGSRPIDGGR